MAARAHAMTSPTDPRPRSHGNLLQRVGLAFMIAILAAVSFAVVYLVNRTIVPGVLSVVAVIGVGLVSGFAARWMLRPHTALLRMTTALATLVIGLLLLGLMTRGDSGLGPTNLWRANPNWIGLAQVALGAVTALLALRAWSAPARATAETPTPQPVETQPPLWQRPLIRMQAWGDGARIQWKESNLFRWLDRTKVRVSTPRTSRAQNEASARENRIALSVTAPQQDKGRAWSRLRWPAIQLPWSRNRMGLKFTSTTEHKCPYCLQTIEPNDRVVVCKICHTPHHADCWAITGVCQIPHYHN